jgi:RNA polymerase sigma-70 factor (ECF subfamily)
MLAGRLGDLVVGPYARAHENSSHLERSIVAARDGSFAALGHLLDHYRDYLLHVASRELASDLVPKIAPSDLVQETFMQAAAAFPRFAGKTEAELRAWLRRILLNSIHDAARFCSAQKRDWELEVPLASAAAGNLADELSSPLPTPSEAFLNEESARAVSLALSQLKDADRAVIEMRSFQGLQFAEIGARLGISTDAARKLWGRAVDRLAATLPKNERS